MYQTLSSPDFGSWMTISELANNSSRVGRSQPIPQCTGTWWHRLPQHSINPKALHSGRERSPGGVAGPPAIPSTHRGLGQQLFNRLYIRTTCRSLNNPDAQPYSIHLGQDLWEHECILKHTPREVHEWPDRRTTGLMRQPPLA